MLRMVVAFKTEAQPLIDHYGLQRRTPGGSFDVYENERHALIVSGLGKARAAAATAYLHAVTGEQRGVLWLNVGVAGHGHLPPGNVVIAHKVVDAATGQAWYPPQIFRHHRPTATLYTVDQPENHYEHDALYDMEAASFYAVAATFESRERVQCCKIVSDNPSQPADELTPRRAGELMRRAAAEVVAFADELSQHAVDHAVVSAGDMAPFLERWHFSVAQQHQLRRALERWSALSDGDKAAASDFTGCSNARETLRALNAELDAKAPDGPGGD